MQGCAIKLSIALMNTQAATCLKRLMKNQLFISRNLRKILSSNTHFRFRFPMDFFSNRGHNKREGRNVTPVYSSGELLQAKITVLSLELKRVGSRKVGEVKWK